MLRFLRPDVFVSVLDPSVADFKESALRYLDRADALVMPAGADARSAWVHVAGSLVSRARRFAMSDGCYCSEELVTFVRERVSLAPHTTNGDTVR